MIQPGLFQRISEARQTLGLGEEATLPEINGRIKTLLKQWHPDCCGEERERCTEMTRRILESAELIRSYCTHYRFSFRIEEVEKYLSPEEWWHKRFGTEPIWSTSGAEQVDDHGRKRPVMGKRR